MALRTGDPAPDFNLPDQDGKIHSLSEFKGKKVVVYFYPKDDTPGCTTEACGFRDEWDVYKEHGIVVIGISYDSPKSHKKFQEKYQLPFLLLSDQEKQVAKTYGAYRDFLNKFTPKRMTFLINEDGQIIKIFEKVDVGNHAKEILEIFAESESNRQAR